MATETSPARVAAQGERIVEAIAHTAQNRVHRTQAVEGLEENTAVAHGFVVKSDVDGHAGARLLCGGMGRLLARLRRLESEERLEDALADLV